MPLVHALLLLLAAADDDWPQWLGPGRNGVTPAAVAPWKEAPKEIWKQGVGEGHSSPIVQGGRCYLHAKVNGKDEEEVVAWEAATGKELWRQAYPRGAFESPFGVGPRATPIASGDKLWTLGVTGILSCWSAADGKKLWQSDTLKEFQAPNLKFGVSCSPIIEGELLLLNVGGAGAGIVAFRKDTGAIAWKALDDKATYSSPIATGEGSKRQAIFLTATGLVGLNPADGSVFWKSPLRDKLSESSSTPALAGDFLIGSSVTTGSSCVKLGLQDGKPAASEAWKNPKLNCYYSTPLAAGADRVYLVSGKLQQPPSATLRCVDAATGRELWNKADIGTYHASMLRTSGGQILLLDDGGSLALLEPSDTEYRELAKSKICGPTWAHPAMAGGRIYVRDKQSLLCLQLAR